MFRNYSVKTRLQLAEGERIDVGAIATTVRMQLTEENR